MSLKQRLISQAACTLIPLGCGAVYLFSAYAPQLAERLGYSASDISYIGMMGTAGTSILGIFAGVAIDKLGARTPILFGAVATLIGFGITYLSYVFVIRSLSLQCFAMALATLGGISAYYACLKVSASNFPDNRGAASALPISAFGLSALLLSVVKSEFFGTRADTFLLFLALSGSALCFIGGFFARMYPRQPQFDEIPVIDGVGTDYFESFAGLNGSSSSTDLAGLTRARYDIKYDTVDNKADLVYDRVSPDPKGKRSSIFKFKRFSNASERSPLLETSQTMVMETTLESIEEYQDNLHGFRLFTNTKFVAQFFNLAVLSGIGQMFIFSVGYIVQAQGYQLGYSPEKTEALQALQVGLISLFSFVGRLLSGTVSDLLHKRRIQRLWLVALSAFLTLIGHMALIALPDSLMIPHGITAVSALFGTAYGMVYAVYPAIIGDYFGLKYYSQNWGLFASAAMFGTGIFNTMFGRVYDMKSVLDVDTDMLVCKLGKECYVATFELSAAFLLFTMTTVLAAIYVYRTKVDFI